MSCIFKVFAILINIIALTQMTLHESMAAEQSIEDNLAKDAAVVKACLDFVDAKTEDETAQKQ